MKQNIFLKLLALCICYIVSNARIQAETINIEVGEYTSSHTFVYDTSSSSATDSYGSESNDVHYSFKINCPTVVLFHHASSMLTDTSMYLLKKNTETANDSIQEIYVAHNGSQLISNERILEEIREAYSYGDSFHILDSLQERQAAICMLLEEGEYDLICEGTAENQLPQNGSIQTKLYFLQAGTQAKYPIHIGNYSCNSMYENTGYYSPNSTIRFYVYYQLKVEVPMSLHAEYTSNREIQMLLYDEQDRLINWEKQEGRYGEKMLSPGTYKISFGTHDKAIRLTPCITLTSILQGNCMDSPIHIRQSEEMGNIDYIQAIDTREYTDNYQGRPTNDVFFTLHLTDSLYTTIAVGLSEEMKKGVLLTQLDSLQTEIGQYQLNNTDIDLKLAAGNHYFICEGIEENGPMTVYIQGELPPREKMERYTPSVCMNYIRMITPNTSCSELDSLYYLSKANHFIYYYDHLGRPVQDIAYKASPLKNDQIVRRDYDDLGRDNRQWLTVTRTSEIESEDKDEVFNRNAGTFLGAEQGKALSEQQYADTSAFNIPVYEPTPFERIVESYGAGAEWQSKGRSKKTHYRTNSDIDFCYRFPINGSREDPSLGNGGFYPSNELDVTEVQDEDGHTSHIFTDKRGYTILIRNIANEDTLDTYQVYDIRGNLCFVLPPNMSDSVKIPKIWTDSLKLQEVLDKYAYQYRYDYRNRRIGQKFPGCAWSEFIYDYKNNKVFSQSSEQKKDKEWSFILSDLLNRPVISGIYHGNLQRSICEASSIYATFSLNGTNNLYGYSLQLPEEISIDSLEVLKVNYYDNYDYQSIDAIHFNPQLSYVEDSDYGKRYISPDNPHCCKGLMTGNIVYPSGKGLDSDSQGTVNCYYYDYNHNLIQKRTSMPNSYWSVVKSLFDFTGNPVRINEEYGASSVSPYNGIGMTKLYSYDHVGRLIQEQHITHKFDTICFTREYDELGRLRILSYKKNKSIFSTAYSYNIRNWMTSIESPLFKEELHYTDGTGTPCYNGNISSISWKAGEEQTTRGYRFTYDGLDRMKMAEYGEGERLASNPNRFNEEVTAYDKTGNILGIRRMGQTGAQEYGLVDNLTLTYSGNQLTKVTDNAASSAYSNGFEFKDGAERETEYTYDENGNLTQDLNRNIKDIQYNFLNLPQRIDFGDGSTTEYLYDAEGRKLRTVHRADGKTTTTDYAGNLIYENGNPIRLVTEYGYVSLPDGMYHYYLQDHQGNNRVVADRNGKVEEVNHYYPFGGMFATTGNIQPYKYNGKELDTRKGLYWYDYGARHYDPAIGRWHVMDPIAENFNQWSPYIYCLNNPIAYVDKNGEIPFLTNLIGAAVGAGVEYIGQVATNILTDQKIQFSDFTNIDIADIGIAAGEGFITSGGSAVRNAFAKAAVSVGTEALQNAVDINASSKEGVSLKIHNTTEVVSNTAIGLLGGEIKMNKKINIMDTQTTNKAVKNARAKQHKQGKPFSSSQVQQVRANNKKKNQMINEVNTIISEQINEMPGIMFSNLGKEIINKDDEKKE